MYCSHLHIRGDGDPEIDRCAGCLSELFLAHRFLKQGGASDRKAFESPRFLSIRDKSLGARFTGKTGVSKGGGAAVVDKELLLLFS